MVREERERRGGEEKRDVYGKGKRKRKEGNERHGEERNGKERKGKEKKGKERKGKERKGKGGKKWREGSPHSIACPS